jgi:hypothetical protein
MDDHQLMRVRADTLFTHNAVGRMLRSNELDGRPAPGVFLGVTRAGSVVRFNDTVPDDLARQLTEIIEHQQPLHSLAIPPMLLGAVRGALSPHNNSPHESGPAYRFPPSITHPHDVVPITDANIEIVRDTFPWLHRELPYWRPCFAVVRDGTAVSICFSSRIGATANEAGLETLPAFRGRGYATAVTAAWGASLLNAGRIPLYSTSWNNLASQHVARRLGLILFGSDATWDI